MKRHLYCGVVAAAVSIAYQAHAADMPVKAPISQPALEYNWTGFYIGINGGGGWGHKDWQFVDTVPGGGSSIPVGSNEGGHDVNGGLAGGQIGANWQTGHLVLGAELQWDWADLKGQHLTPVFGNLLQTTVESEGTFTGRIGYAWDAVLLYAKGGGAWVEDHYGRGFGPSGPIFAESRDTTMGWTVGAGIEYGFAAHWSVAVEYDYLDFGTHQFFFANNAVGAGLGFLPFNERISQNVQMATARLNFRF